MSLSTNLMSIIGFYLLIGVLIIIFRKKIDVQHKILFLFKTKAGLKLIDKIAKLKSFWKIFGYVAIPVGLVGLVFTVYMLVLNVVNMFRLPGTTAGASLVIPGVHIPGISIYLPFWYGILSLIVVLFVHEFSHGVVARANDLKIKSAGVGMLGPLPLAFVEPDEKQIEKTKLKKKLSVFAAGPFANICTAIIVTLIASLVLIPIASNISAPSGIEVIDITEGFPAYESGIRAGEVITGFNGHEVLYVSDFISKMQESSPGDTILLKTKESVVEVTAIGSPEDETKAHLGVSFKQSLKIREQVTQKYGNKLPWGVFYLIQFFYWLYVLNLGIGLINLLPLGPLDGGRMMNAVFKKYFKNNTARKLFSLLSFSALIILVLNIFLPITMGLA